MNRIKILLIITLCCLIVSNAQTEPAENDPAAQWEKTIRTFEDWDKKNSFPKDAVLFVGSSSIRLWPTRECFGQFDVINRGFGGSHISDVVYFTKRIVLPYKPKVIVFYAGDNDITGGKTAERVFDDYRKFVGLAQKQLPATRIIFISIKPSGSRWPLWNVMKDANKMIEDFSQKDDRLYYLDAAAPLLDSNSRPKDELFLSDRLHLNDNGYELWTKLLTPVIEKAMNQ
jgi:lysophospholipase L1-like esterase